MMRILTPCLITVGILVWSGVGLAVNFSNGGWSTTFNYPQACSAVGAEGFPSCNAVANDGINWSVGGGNNVGGNYTKAIAEANNPDGDGGLGFRAYVQDGSNNQSGLVAIQFSQPQPEFFLRWYQRYEAGFRWSGGEPLYDKTFYIRGGPGGSGSTQVLPEHGAGRFILNAQGTFDATGQAASNPSITWTDVFGAPSDGEWHLFEIYLKMDTNRSDGIGKMWIDGTLVINATGVDWSAGSSVMRQGWTDIDFHNNQSSPNNGRVMYVDYDDIEIYNVTPPNRDSFGNPWIGPLNGSTGGGGSPAPMSPAPVQVTFNDSIENNNFASRGRYDNTNKVLANSGATSGSTKSIEHRFDSGAS